MKSDQITFEQLAPLDNTQPSKTQNGVMLSSFSGKKSLSGSTFYLTIYYMFIYLCKVKSTCSSMNCMYTSYFRLTYLKLFQLWLLWIVLACLWIWQYPCIWSQRSRSMLLPPTETQICCCGHVRYDASAWTDIHTVNPIADLDRWSWRRWRVSDELW